MNIDLSGAKSSNKKKKIGLNKRGGPSNGNVFGGDSSSSDDEQQPISSRAAVNQALEKEQKALRKRAQAALESAAYDFDGSYDDTAAEAKQQKIKESENSPEKKSRYISDLLKASEKRQQEREIVLERKIGREQDAEDQQADFRGKEKFVTSAYRQKLAERNAWLADDKRKVQEEQENDVTKRSGGMANFYGNFSRNVAVGGGDNHGGDNQGGDNHGDDEAVSKGKQESNSTPSQENVTPGFQEEFEQKSPPTNDEGVTNEGEIKATSTQTSKKPTMREIREKKVAEARIRYFKRHGIQAG